MPYVEGKTLRGWGVVSPAPWKFAGLFSNKPDAEKEAARLGSNYLVRFGDNRKGMLSLVLAAFSSLRLGSTAERRRRGRALPPMR